MRHGLCGRSRAIKRLPSQKFEAMQRRSTPRLKPFQFLTALAVVTLFTLARIRWPQLDG